MFIDLAQATQSFQRWDFLSNFIAFFFISKNKGNETKETNATLIIKFQINVFIIAKTKSIFKKSVNELITETRF